MDDLELEYVWGELAFRISKDGKILKTLSKEESKSLYEKSLIVKKNVEDGFAENDDSESLKLALEAAYGKLAAEYL